jgi:hypothetical protein
VKKKMSLFFVNSIGETFDVLIDDPTTQTIYEVKQNFYEDYGEFHPDCTALYLKWNKELRDTRTLAEEGIEDGHALRVVHMAEKWYYLLVTKKETPCIPVKFEHINLLSINKSAAYSMASFLEHFQQLGSDIHSISCRDWDYSLKSSELLYDSTWSDDEAILNALMSSRSVGREKQVTREVNVLRQSDIGQEQRRITLHSIQEASSEIWEIRVREASYSTHTTANLQTLDILRIQLALEVTKCRRKVLFQLPMELWMQIRSFLYVTPIEIAFRFPAEYPLEPFQLKLSGGIPLVCARFMYFSYTFRQDSVASQTVVTSIVSELEKLIEEGDSYEPHNIFDQH